MRFVLAPLTAAAFASIACAQTGHIIAIGDEWLLSDQAFIDQPAQSLQLANNIANYFNGPTGNFLVLSNSPPVGSVAGQRGVLGDSLAFAMIGGGHSWIVNPEDFTLSLAALQSYDAVFLSGGVGSGAANAAILAQYVNGGGSVLVMAGTGDIGGPQDEANAWNPFLNQFGIGFGNEWFASGASLLNIPTLPSAHPVGSLISTASWGFGQTAMDLDPSDPLNEVALFGNFSAFGGPTGFDVGAVPIIATYNLVTPAPGAMTVLALGGVAMLRRRRA
jgi:MYXO-CTERM domain-containing protein